MGVRKKGIAVFLSLVLLTASFSLTVNAQTMQHTDNAASRLVPGGNEHLDWSIVTSLSVSLSFNNGRGTLSGSVIGHPATKEITGYAILERQNSNGTYTQIAKWDNLRATGHYLIFSQTYYVAKGHTYRLVLTATAYKDGTAETVSGSRSAYAY